MAKEMIRRFPPGAVAEATARRFIKARNGDMAKATQMLYDYEAWRRSFGCPVDPKSCLTELLKGKTFLHGVDRQGNALLYHFVRKQDPSARDLQEAVRAAVFWAEQAEKQADHPGGPVALPPGQGGDGAEPGGGKEQRRSQPRPQHRAHPPEQLPRAARQSPGVSDGDWLQGGLVVVPTLP